MKNVILTEKLKIRTKKYFDEKKISGDIGSFGEMGTRRNLASDFKGINFIYQAQYFRILTCQITKNANLSENNVVLA